MVPLIVEDRLLVKALRIKQESPAVADKPAWHKSMPKLLQFECLQRCRWQYWYISIHLAVVVSEICEILRIHLKFKLNSQPSRTTRTSKSPWEIVRDWNFTFFSCENCQEWFAAQSVYTPWSSVPDSGRQTETTECSRAFEQDKLYLVLWWKYFYHGDAF